MILQGFFFSRWLICGASSLLVILGGSTIPWAAEVKLVSPVASGAPTSTAIAAPDYESREALPVAPRRYDVWDDLPKTVFASVSGSDPKEGLGEKNLVEMTAQKAPQKADSSKDAKTKAVPSARKVAAAGKPKKLSRVGALLAKAAAKRRALAQNTKTTVARLLPSKTRKPASTTRKNHRPSASASKVDRS